MPCEKQTEQAAKLMIASRAACSTKRTREFITEKMARRKECS
jgi:hypothetical protein